MSLSSSYLLLQKEAYPILFSISRSFLSLSLNGDPSNRGLSLFYLQGLPLVPVTHLSFSPQQGLPHSFLLWFTPSACNIILFPSSPVESHSIFLRSASSAYGTSISSLPIEPNLFPFHSQGLLLVLVAHLLLLQWRMLFPYGDFHLTSLLGSSLVPMEVLSFPLWWRLSVGTLSISFENSSVDLFHSSQSQYAHITPSQCNAHIRSHSIDLTFGEDSSSPSTRIPL